MTSQNQQIKLWVQRMLKLIVHRLHNYSSFTSGDFPYRLLI